MNLVEIRKIIKIKKVEMMKKIAPELGITQKQAKLLEIISSKSSGNELVNPLDLKTELSEIGIEVFTEEWTINLGVLHKKNLVKLGVRLNTDPENTTTDQEDNSEC